jgi:hypothetical protein
LTILIATQQPDYVVLGADSLTFGSESGKPVAITRSKLVTHKALPLALAATGFAGIIEDQTFVTDMLAQVVADVDDASHLALDVLIKRICAQLEPLIQKAKRKADGDVAEWLKTEVLIARHVDAKADLTILTIPGCRYEQTDGFSTNPGSLATFYRSGKYANLQPLDDARDRARFILTMIEEGIAEEARLNSGKNQEAGPPAEVVIIDREGVRHP